MMMICCLSMQIMLIIEGAFAVVCALVVIIYFSQVGCP
jgi:hypothetical protein